MFDAPHTTPATLLVFAAQDQGWLRHLQPRNCKYLNKMVHHPL